jgi:hypothetical protein
MENTLKLHWNFEKKNWSLIEIGTEVKEGMNRSYYIPSEAHFIDPRKSKLVRLAWKLHLFLRKFTPEKPQKINPNSSVFKNNALGEKWD